MPKLSILGKTVLATFLLQTIVLTALECLVVYFHVSFVRNFTLSETGVGISESDLIYHAIFILTQAFQLVICVDALFNRNTIQLVALAILNFITVAYAAIQTYQHFILEDQGTDGAIWTPVDPTRFSGPEDAKHFFQARMRPLEYTIIGIVVACSILLGILTRYLIIEFGWENYQKYSADLSVRKAFVDITLLMTLIKMDVFFVGTYAIQLIPSEKLGYTRTMTETIAVFVIGTITFIVAWYGTAKEQKYCLLSVIGILALNVVYALYSIIHVNMHSNHPNDPYLYTRRFLTLFLAVMLCLTVATIVNMGLCIKNMMKGFYVLTVYGNDGENDPDYDDLSTPTTKREKRRSQLAAARVNNRRFSFDN
ncbi:11722_t:CDS:2 [Paraglomus brasilianum]|uniref:11722_t:CDS:1 n=1 Tax=Paraglomus brasilianum TaxID=144538 RepID=A0A9N9CY21_9GLOM|nr:11722_t:CDS:2 [Paraglomus brasilianum]